MENGNENNYDHNDKQELSPLLLVPIIDAAQNTNKSRRSQRFMALLLLLLVSATATAAAAMMVLRNGSSSPGVHPIASAFSSVFGTRRNQGESCASPWWNTCRETLSCFDSGPFGRYCVPNGQENACCGFLGDDVASGINCIKDYTCDSRNKIPGTDFGGKNFYDTVYTCHPTTRGDKEDMSFAKKGSCNVNTGEPADILIDFKHCDFSRCH